MFVTVQKQEEALFSLVTIPWLCWNNWHNVGNSMLQKKNPTDGGGKEVEYGES